MTTTRRVLRGALALLLLLVLVAAGCHVLASGLWPRTMWPALPEGAGLIGAALILVAVAARLGRLEPTLVTLLPLALGACALEPARTWLLDDGAASDLGLTIGAVLAAQHALALTTWHLMCWRRRRQPRALWPLLAGMGVSVGLFVVAASGGAPQDLGRAGLLAYACLALPAQLLVPLGWRLLLRHRGPNGTPALRHAFGALWILWTMSSRGLWFLLTDRSADRRRAAVDAIHRIAAYTTAHAPRTHVVHADTGSERFATPRVLVANHSSMFDILAVQCLPAPMVLLIRDWVWKTPVMGHMTRAAGYINVDALAHEEVVERARQAIAAGFSLLVFPEGTRSRDGRVGRFKNGAFAIARAVGVPVTPVALAGTLTFVRADTWWLGDGDGRISVLDDMDPAKFTGQLADKRMAREARDRIRAEVRRLTPQTRSGPRWRLLLAGLYRYLGATVSHYTASKARRDPLVEAIPRLSPGDGPVLHAGCGYALLSGRLALSQPWRSIRGIDCDPRKVEVAAAALGETTGARFELGDLRSADLGRPETILLVDVLHYWPVEVQEALVQRLAAALARGGRLVFRDGVRGAPGHGAVHLGERLALLFGFTRAGAGLHFQTQGEYRALFENAGFAVSSAHEDLGLSSNLVLVLQRDA